MVIYSKLEDAKEFGNELSKVQLKPISIYKETKTGKFVIFLTKENSDKYHVGHWTHSFEYLCVNYETPFTIGYKLHKDRTPSVEQFPTKKLMEISIKEKRLYGYNVTILNGEKSIQSFLNNYSK